MAGALLFVLGASRASCAADFGAKPNIVFILADDLGYGDLGCFGQDKIQTPNIDRLAAEGVRFTRFCAGASVCAPSRCVLMTGKHGGHCRVRGNAPTVERLKQSLTQDDQTVAALLKRAGYATALVGKWGIGDFDTPGHPLNQGFDFFFGYLDQIHSHLFYPEWIWRNREKVALPNKVRPVPVGKGGNWGVGGVTIHAVVYSPKLMLDEAIQFIDRNKGRPFFLYYATTIPHANNEAAAELGNGAEVPDLGIYKDKPWSEPDKGYAAMITYLDAQVGVILGRLKALGLDDKTLVIFTSDNGPEKQAFAGYDTTHFRSSGPFRGFKRDNTDGGIRVPFIARWPGKIKKGSDSAHVGYFGDVLRTFMDLAGESSPDGLDSVSFLPALLGRPEAQIQPRLLYWEYHGGADSAQAALLDGRWKIIRQTRRAAPLEVYDTQKDVEENSNIAAFDLAITEQLRAYLDTARDATPTWPLFDKKLEK